MGQYQEKIKVSLCYHSNSQNLERLRCDQYHWVTHGVYSVKSANYNIKKRSNAVDAKDLPKEQGNMTLELGVLGLYQFLCFTLHRGPHCLYSFCT